MPGIAIKRCPFRCKKIPLRPTIGYGPFTTRRTSHLVRVGANGDAKRPCETEVGQLDGAVAVDEEVLRLEIAVQDAVGVAELNALEQLVPVREMAIAAGCWR